jgi:hypothetical protein
MGGAKPEVTLFERGSFEEEKPNVPPKSLIDYGQ